MQFYRLLSFKLFVLIFFIFAGLSVGFSLYYLKIESEQYQEIALQCAKRTSEIIVSSTRNAMMRNQKVNTFEIINSIAERNGIEKICIFDKTGKIVYSTKKEELNQLCGMDHRACSPCHDNSGSIKVNQSSVWHQISFSNNNERLLGYVKPIQNEKSCATSDCHFHPEDKTYLGILCVTMSLAGMDEIVDENRDRMVSTNIMITLILGLTVGLFIWIFVHVPVNKLILGIKEISSGNLGYKIESKSKDEIGILATSFNDMSKDLKEAKNEITIWSNQLENRVKEKTEELEQTQKRNIQIEKMASLGQLSATVAHELNNPISGILTYSKLIQKKLGKETLTEDEKNAILKNLKMIESESQRSGDIVKNMLLFSRQEAVEMKLKDIKNVIESSIELISHHLQLHNIELKKFYQVNIPEIYVDENQIKQALLALYVNAVEAMENEGTLTIKTGWKKPNNFINIYISDSGKGIPENVKAQIFEPFFTTKNAVKGVGLGLSSVYAIINKHNGEITVESELEKGTTFIIKLPLKQNR